MWWRNASFAVVAGRGGVPRMDDVVGIIAKEHVADSVAESIRPYTRASAIL
jgi:CIC family chloride channel protein